MHDRHRASQGRLGDRVYLMFSSIGYDSSTRVVTTAVSCVRGFNTGVRIVNKPSDVASCGTRRGDIGVKGKTSFRNRTDV
jgi:hypothetical protein